MKPQNIPIFIQTLIATGAFGATSLVTSAQSDSMNEPLKLVFNLVLGLAAFASVAAMVGGAVSLALPTNADAGGYKAKRIIAYGAIGLAVSMILNIIVSIVFGK